MFRSVLPTKKNIAQCQSRFLCTHKIFDGKQERRPRWVVERSVFLVGKHERNKNKITN
jgi:hypothetical protein